MNEFKKNGRRNGRKNGKDEQDNMTALRWTVFLDRDGVIIENCPGHVKTWDDVRFLDGVFSALRRLAGSPAAVVIVSNQGAVGREMMTLDTAWDLQNRIVAAIEKEGGRIDASYLCPHHPNDGCDCRKPQPGMIRQAENDLKLDLTRSWLVGDAETDLMAASAAGMRAMMVRTGRGIEQERLLTENKWPIVADLSAAVEYILQHIKE
jgi:D-glycero-D-manno-heptose 1,7-bisphosphate phosphatase